MASIAHPQSSASPDNDSSNAASSGAPVPPRQNGVATIPFDRPVALTASGAPLLNPRSCVTCRRRRVRCDKMMPCSNCRRAQSDCMYPAPGRAPRQTRPNVPSKAVPTEREADLIKRLRKLEGLVQELSGSSAGAYDAESPKAQEDHISSQSDIVKETADEVKRETESRNFTNMNKQLGRLILHDGEPTARYVNSGFFAKLNDELDELRNEMEAVDDLDDFQDDTTPEQSPPQNLAADSDHHSFLLGYRSADVDLAGLHPLPAQTSFLWQIYLENIEPLVKVLHIPTMSRLMTKVRRGEHDLRPGDEALVFAIYYSAVVSMESDEAQTNLGASKSHYIAQFRFALEQALAKANLLTTSDMAVLQAFAIFLTVVKCHDDSRLCWTLTSLCVRMAQALGLHRDGQQLGLPPFEVEMRRRLWWAVVAIDLRSAEEMGSDLIVNDENFDTQLPTNINDTDIDPSFTEMPTPRQGRTDTAICLVRYEIIALSRRLFTAMTQMRPVDPKNVEKSLEDRERMLVEVYDRMEDKFLKHVVMDEDPVFWMASLISRVIMAKIGLIIYQPVLFPGTGPEASQEIRSRLWMSTIEIVEYNHILNVDPRCRQWRWLFQSYRQWHAIAYMLLELSRRPWSVTSERAWEAAQILQYDHPIEGTNNAEHTAAWMPIKRLYAKAKKHREAEMIRLRADPAAARQLDIEDRLKPVLERIGPAPGMETRMSELRLRWRKLFRSGDFVYNSEYPTSIMQEQAQGAGPQPTPQPRSVHVQESEPPKQNAEVTNNALSDANLNQAWQNVYSGNPGIAVYFEGGTMEASNPGGLFPGGGSLGSMSSIASPAASGAATSTYHDHDPQQYPDNHLSPWPGQNDFQHNHNGDLGDIDDLFQHDALNPNGLSSVTQGMDLSMELGEVEDIDWNNWDETLKLLSKPAMSGGTGSWGGM
ncbi:Zn(2)-C6 fungal-type domain-containing protein [Fusarium sp. Ph1]|nr:Zn(2)-C6 fungal-type domain-containing protein [Fusarium sp. Ph1]